MNDQNRESQDSSIAHAERIADDQHFLRDLLQTLSSTESLLHAALSGLDRDAQTIRPASHEWTIVEVLCHLRDLEREVFPVRTALIRKNNGSAVAAFDEQAWARDRKYSEDDPYRALEDFCAARRTNLELLRQVGDDELDSSAVHSAFGAMTLRVLFADWAASDLVHTAQIQRIRLWRFYPDLGAFQKYFKNALRIKE